MEGIVSKLKIYPSKKKKKLVIYPPIKYEMYFVLKNKQKIKII